MFDSDPLGVTAVGHLRELRNAMPGLLATAGLAGAEVSYLGDTTIGLSLADQARADLVRVAVAVGLVNLVLLVLFLRALVAPLYLLSCVLNCTWITLFQYGQILFSVFVIVIAALNLVLDFDFIEQGARYEAPKYMEWYGAFGLMVTLIWLYLEILRLLRKIQDRR